MCSFTKQNCTIIMIVLILFFVRFLHLLGDDYGNSKSTRLIATGLACTVGVVRCSALLYGYLDYHYHDCIIALYKHLYVVKYES